MDCMVKTRLGMIQGQEQDGCMTFFGVPYAQPPVGELRWKAPQPLQPWEGVRKADTYPHRSMQTKPREVGFYDKEFRDDPRYIPEPSEDCLYLNIWTPKHVEGRKLPVAFWIHGGAFMGGSGIEKEFDGIAYAKRDVILVTVNYRLGVFGFLAHPWLSEENENHVSGNYGILDQIAALTWVYENIAAFGGDPENITVFGQSAGAMSTQTLISSPLTGNMIRKAIFQSGGGYRQGLNRDDLTLETLETYGTELTRLAGVENLSQLRAFSTQAIMELVPQFMQAVFPKSKGLFLVPAIDGYVMPVNYTQAIETEAIKDIPYLLGCTKDDILTTPEQIAAGELSPLQNGCRAFAEIRSRQGRKPVYVYDFVRELPGDDAGAFHSSELWYTFGTLDRAWRPFTEADYALSKSMLSAWTDFMRTGNPEGDGKMEWPAYTKDRPFVKVFDV